MPEIKSRSEIVMLREALKKARDKPCDCKLRGQGHVFQCVTGGAMMQSNIDVLNWVLGMTPPDSVNDRIIAWEQEGGK